MLWLAGLMGLVGVGAASIAVVHLQEDDEEDDLAPLESAPNDGTDLLDEIATLRSEAFEEDDFHLSDETDDLILYKEIIASQDLSVGDDPYDVFAPISDEDDTAELLPLPLNAISPLTSPLAGDWITNGEPHEVVDYEAEKERLMLVWDDMAHGAAEPEVDVTEDPDDPEVMQVTMNGAPVADIYGDPELSLADLTIIPLSSALIAGLRPVMMNTAPQRIQHS